MKPGRVARASEAIAAGLLEEMGFRVVGRRERIVVGGVEVGEVDIIAERGGALYAVEVKAGPLDVGGVRQAYVNAELLNARPLVVARGFADDSARALAERLGVEVIVLPDSIPLTPDEVYEAVRRAVVDAVVEALSRLAVCPELAPGDERILEAIASSPTIKDAAEALGATVDELARWIASLRRRGVLRERGPYHALRADAAAVLLCNRLRGARGRAGGAVPRP